MYVQCIYGWHRHNYMPYHKVIFLNTVHGCLCDIPWARGHKRSSEVFTDECFCVVGLTSKLWIKAWRSFSCWWPLNPTTISHTSPRARYGLAQASVAPLTASANWFPDPGSPVPRLRTVRENIKISRNITDICNNTDKIAERQWNVNTVNVE